MIIVLWHLLSNEFLRYLLSMQAHIRKVQINSRTINYYVKAWYPSVCICLGVMYVASKRVCLQNHIHNTCIPFWSSDYYTYNVDTKHVHVTGSGAMKIWGTSGGSGNKRLQQPSTKMLSLWVVIDVWMTYIPFANTYTYSAYLTKPYIAHFSNLHFQVVNSTLQNYELTRHNDPMSTQKYRGTKQCWEITHWYSM